MIELSSALLSRCSDSNSGLVMMACEKSTLIELKKVSVVVVYAWLTSHKFLNVRRVFFREFIVNIINIFKHI